MIIENFNNKESWLEARRGRITGTKVKDLVLKRATKPKIGFYEIIADRIAVPASQENPMDRGKRLEEYGVERFEQQTGKKVNTDLVIWSRDDNKNISISPDGYIGETEAVEVKCLSSARHIEAYLTEQIPSEYEYQAIQYFVVNDELQKLYFIFYDPRITKDLFWIEIERKDIEDKIAETLTLEIEALNKINEVEKQMTF